ncbi:aryl-phospho-beta-D-glucosidase BglC (GH1 family) [Motilibacter peucedani]|uniref:Aryl-phospho-beta-D-glucosidase BglC (GH1 family) n=1 Tax=Motilibacter peucedani TaxID=598650 RepID=A0A420XRF3_9ACTN|nr:cellulase family glycosylhydrolase [Motilibacter peucedani]RKS77465.1 aryl-phospho-beta-D-glucosidase BglC (GH1 family) [Motilibacter peucedani]
MSENALTHVRTRGTSVLDVHGQPVRLRGVCVGGWLNMENFVTGYGANEWMMRAEVRKVLGDERYELFFERLLTSFFGEADAAFLAETGLNCVRVPVNYRHFEDDARPFVIKQDAFRHLDRLVDACAAHGITTVVDLHALPGSQNQHWHSDNATHRALFWEHPHFQDRVVGIWEAIAEHYKDNVWVAGYNLMNEPADESRAVVGPFYKRLVAAIRAIDDKHVIFLDGNTYSTEFDIFDEPFENTIYTCHDYVPKGLGRSNDYSKAAAEEKFLQRSEYSRRTGTPIYVGEFGPIYTGDPAVDDERYQILHDQLEIYRDHDAGWASWMYKDIGRQGLTAAAPDSPYRRLVSDFVAKKDRLGSDQWGSDGWGPREVTQPVQDLMDREFPDFDPYPWGRFDWVRTLLNNITFAQPLALDYARLFRGLDDSELVALADSFAFDDCVVRERLRAELAKG